MAPEKIFLSTSASAGWSATLPRRNKELRLSDGYNTVNLISGYSRLINEIDDQKVCPEV